MTDEVFRWRKSEIWIEYGERFGTPGDTTGRRSRKRCETAPTRVRAGLISVALPERQPQNRARTVRDFAGYVLVAMTLNELASSGLVQRTKKQ